jgi:hypothetical protein
MQRTTIEAIDVTRSHGRLRAVIKVSVGEEILHADTVRLDSARELISLAISCGALRVRT